MPQLQATAAAAAIRLNQLLHQRLGVERLLLDERLSIELLSDDWLGIHQWLGHNLLDNHPLPDNRLADANLLHSDLLNNHLLRHCMMTEPSERGSRVGKCHPAAEQHQEQPAQECLETMLTVAAASFGSTGNGDQCDDESQSHH